MTENAYMAKHTEIVKVSDGGRIVIPAAFRKELDLHVGDDVVVELEGGSLRLCTRREGLRRAQEILRKYLQGGPSLADELIAERHAEAARE